MAQTRAIRIEWAGMGLRFRGGGTDPETPPVMIDGDNETAPGPMLLLLVAAASCAASDVVLILEKMRVKLQRCDVEVTGTRRDEEPRRFTGIAYRFILAGGELDRSKAERAVSLSIQKYCSVVASLATDIVISFDIELA